MTRGENSMKNHLFGIVAAIAVAGLISLFTAHRIEAQYSSPVKVVNSTSAPALNSSVDDHGRIPYQSELFGKGCTGFGCTFTFGPVPSGHRLVIEHVSGSIDVLGSVTQVNVQLNPTVPIGTLDRYSSFYVPEQFDQVTLAYLDASQSVDVLVILVGGGTFGPNSRLGVKGYLLDCTAAPCPAIAN
jgi:hypothetical protein